MARVVLAMSGGVDSSVSAYLLQKQGYDVVGLFMRTGVHSDADDHRADHKKGCCSAIDAGDARRIADRMDIPFYALDFEQDFGRIIDYFADEYLTGRTPNPCVVCNSWLKFGRLFTYARQLEADFIATGHYARIVHDDGEAATAPGRSTPTRTSRMSSSASAARSCRACSSPSASSPRPRCATSPATWGCASPTSRTASKSASSPATTTPPSSAPAGPEAATAGKFVDTAGHVLGEHDGIDRFTVGQRKGLGIAAGSRRYVLQIVPGSNDVVLGDREDLLAGGLVASRVNWLCPTPAGRAALPGQDPLPPHADARRRSSVTRRRRDGAFRRAAVGRHAGAGGRVLRRHARAGRRVDRVGDVNAPRLPRLADPQAHAVATARASARTASPRPERARAMRCPTDHLTREQLAEQVPRPTALPALPRAGRRPARLVHRRAGRPRLRPTGTGKTLIAQAALFEALHTGTVAYYTTPLIALTEQKFQEMQASRRPLGLPAPTTSASSPATAASTPTPASWSSSPRSCSTACCTPGRTAGRAETFDFSHVSAVVMDEFHNFADLQRGIVWELSLAHVAAARPPAAAVGHGRQRRRSSSPGWSAATAASWSWSRARSARCRSPSAGCRRVPRRPARPHGQGRGREPHDAGAGLLLQPRRVLERRRDAQGARPAAARRPRAAQRRGRQARLARRRRPEAQADAPPRRRRPPRRHAAQVPPRRRGPVRAEAAGRRASAPRRWRRASTCRRGRWC